TRTDLGENHLVAAHEELHAEHAPAAERRGDGRRLTLCLGQRGLAHRLRLPRFAIVAVFLAMADRGAEAHAADMSHGQHGDLVVERHQTLDDDPALARTPAGLRVVPGMPQLARFAHHALALAGGTHHRLDHEGVAYRGDRLVVLRLVAAETVR